MMIIKNWRNFAYKLIIIGTVQYIILTAIAMVFYAGGTILNPLSEGYFFWGNFFSDLGRLVALSGNSNTISYIIFTITALILCSSFIPFSIAFPNFFREDKKQFLLSRIGSTIGLISIGFLIGGTLTPWDIFSNIHLLFANLFNLTGLFVVLFYSLAILYNKEYPNRYAHVYFFLLIFAVIYTVILLLLPKSITTEAIIIQASLQKFSHYLFVLCFLIQGYGAWRLDSRLSWRFEKQV